MAEDAAIGASKTANPAAVSLALAGASRIKADAYLRDQCHHLHEQLKQKWGEALAYAGKREEAKKQFALAAALDLTPADRAELFQAGARQTD